MVATEGSSGALPPCENKIIVKTDVLFVFAQHFSVPKLLKYQYEIHAVNGNSGQVGGLLFAESKQHVASRWCGARSVCMILGAVYMPLS